MVAGFPWKIQPKFAHIAIRQILCQSQADEFKKNWKVEEHRVSTFIPVNLSKLYHTAVAAVSAVFQPDKEECSNTVDCVIGDSASYNNNRSFVAPHLKRAHGANKSR